MSIRSGEVADDVNFHLAESEQRQGGFAAGVHVDDDTVVDAAGGWSVSLLPGATDQVRMSCRVAPQTSHMS